MAFPEHALDPDNEGEGCPDRHDGDCCPENDRHALPQQDPAPGGSAGDEDRRGELGWDGERAKDAGTGDAETDEPLRKALTAFGLGFGRSRPF